MKNPWTEWQEAPPAEFAVVGDPVSHSLSPAMHAAAYRQLDLPYRYTAVRTPLDQFSQAMEHLIELGYDGVNVTVPLKEAAFAWCEGGDPRIGAVNTLRFEDRSGTNTDAPGFLRTLRDHNIGPCDVLLLGAGGSARAVLVALADAGFQVKIYNRTKARAEEVLRLSRCKAEVAASPSLESIRLVVNATSSGLQGATPEVNWESAAPECVAYDLYYQQGPTPFLKDAASRGLRCIDGRELLAAQGALSFEWWTGLPAPREAMLAAIQ